MLDKLMRKLRLLMPVPNTFNPAQFEDPIALKTSWTPARSGGASFRTHKLVKVGSNRMEFRASIGAIMFYLFFFLFGTGIFISFFSSWFPQGRFSPDWPTILPLVIGLIFACIGGFMLFAITAPVVFERGRGLFWKGRRAPDAHETAIHGRGTDHFIRIENIHALQLIDEYCRGNKSSYYSYELNIVLIDGKRITVVDHGNVSKLREDADILARFLDKPLWDATTRS